MLNRTYQVMFHGLRVIENKKKGKKTILILKLF